MKFTEETSETKRIIFVRVSGDIHKEELASMGSEIRARANEGKYRILFDFRKAKNYVTIVEAYNWFSDYYDPINQRLKYVRTAHLVGEENKDFFRFVENTFCNQGADLRLFANESAAVEWLESQHPD